MKDSDRHRSTPPFEPPVNRTENGRYLHLTISLPGIKEEQIRIDLEKTTITLSIFENGVMREKTMPAPRGSRLFKKKFSEGMLDICLEKTVS
ncbi:MAG: hypothetical protein ABFC24_07375 [Methanoregulaceae archaeon]